MGKNPLMDILRKESPFFIADIEQKYPKYKRSYIWEFIHLNPNLFEWDDPVKNGRPGRPAKQYRVVDVR